MQQQTGMNTRQPNRRQSIQSYDFAGNIMLLSNERAGWNHLAARYYRSPSNYYQSVPAFDLDALAIQLGGATPLSGKIAQKPYHVHSVPGDIYLLPKGEESEWRAQESCNLLHLYPTSALLASVALQVADTDPQRVEFVPGVQLRDPLIHQIGLALLETLRTNAPLDGIYVESLSQVLAVHMLRKYATFSTPIAEPTGGMANITLQRALEYIDANLAHDLSLDTIAAVAGMSPYHFTRLFKQSVGQPLHQYVTHQRLDEARRLLLAGRHTIAEVAVLTGFADQSHLHRHFRAAYGTTPGALLEQSKNVQRARKNIQDPATGTG